MSLFGIPSDVIMTDKIFQESRLQAVSSLVSSTDYQVFANNIRVINAHETLTRVLDGIPFVTLKGYASAYYYPNPYKRPMGDVDFYVAPNNYKKASEALLNAGFKKIEHEHERHEEFSKDGVIFELHSEIKGIPNGLDGIKTSSPDAERKVRYYLSDVIDTSEKIQTEYGEIIIPDAFHHGLIMLLHIAGHVIVDGGVGLRHICDWAVYADKIDLEQYKDMYEDMGIWIFACQLTALCTKYLGLRDMKWLEPQNDSFLEAFIEDIVSGGNFGRKENSRGIINRLTDSDNKRLSLINATKKRFPVANRHPILIPAAIAYWGGRYSVRCLTGKRKSVSTKDFKSGKSRNELYKQFNLFKT